MNNMDIQDFDFEIIGEESMICVSRKKDNDEVEEIRKRWDTPQKIKAFLDERIYRQNEAKRAAALI